MDNHELRDVFELDIRRDEFDWEGFSLHLKNLTITFVDRNRSELNMMQKGDIVTAVNSSLVASAAEYYEASRGAAEFTITLERPKVDSMKQRNSYAHGEPRSPTRTYTLGSSRSDFGVRMALTGRAAGGSMAAPEGQHSIENFAGSMRNVPAGFRVLRPRCHDQPSERPAVRPDARQLRPASAPNVRQANSQHALMEVRKDASDPDLRTAYMTNKQFEKFVRTNLPTGDETLRLVRKSI